MIGANYWRLRFALFVEPRPLRRRLPLPQVTDAKLCDLPAPRVLRISGPTFVLEVRC